MKASKIKWLFRYSIYNLHHHPSLKHFIIFFICFNHTFMSYKKLVVASKWTTFNERRSFIYKIKCGSNKKVIFLWIILISLYSTDISYFTASLIKPSRKYHISNSIHFVWLSIKILQELLWMNRLTKSFCFSIFSFATFQNVS